MAWGFQRKAPCSKNLQCHTQKVENLFQEAIHRDSRRNSCIRIWPFHPQELANLNQKLHPQERRIETKKKKRKNAAVFKQHPPGSLFQLWIFPACPKKKRWKMTEVSEVGTLGIPNFQRSQWRCGHRRQSHRWSSFRWTNPGQKMCCFRWNNDNQAKGVVVWCWKNLGPNLSCTGFIYINVCIYIYSSW